VIIIGKNPAFQFYPGDWTRDLDDHDLEIEGAWIRIICRLWWSETRGEATKPLREWARILRKTEQKTLKILHILLEKHLADGAILDNQMVNLISRRMKRDSEISQIRYKVGILGGNPALKKSNENLDNQSSNQKRRSSSSTSSSSSVSSNNKHIDAPAGVNQETWNAFIEMRKAMKAPLTAFSAKLIISNLTKLSNDNGNGMEMILQQSIANNWKGVFPLKEGYGRGHFVGAGNTVEKAGRAKSDGTPYPVDAEC
jgi:hypothetical protein